MKLSKIIDPRFKPVLQKLSQEKLPLKAAFKIKGIIIKSNEEFSKYDDLRLESLKKYSVKDAESGELLLDEHGNAALLPDLAPEFVRELNELTSLELEIGTIKVSELGDNLNLTADELMVLDGVIVED